MANGRFPQLKGGLMLSAILLMGAVSLIFYAALKTQKTAAEFAQRNILHFEAKVMRELFLHDYFALPPAERPEEGTEEFNIGTLHFRNEDTLMIQVTIGDVTVSLDMLPTEVAQLDTYEEATETSEITEGSSSTETFETSEDGAILETEESFGVAN